MNPALETLILALRENSLLPGDTLFLGAEPHPELPACVGWQPFFPMAEAWKKSGRDLVEKPSGPFQNILFLPGKSKDEVLAGFANAYDLLAPGGILITALANTSGAARFEKELKKVTPILFSFSKNKCRAFAAEKHPEWDQSTLNDWRRLAEPTEIPDSEPPFFTIPGVFSAKKIDPGSALLAQYLPPSLHGDIADLGAGWGYLSSIALQKSEAISKIHLFEADARSLACARLNISSEKSHFHWHDVTAGLPDTYHHILCNPPFHTGQSQDLDLGKAFLSSAAAALRPGGTLYLVANRHLPYEAHLASLGLRSRSIFEDHAYKVIISS